MHQGSRMKSLRKLSPFPGARSRWEKSDLPSVVIVMTLIYSSHSSLCVILIAFY
jgi:hypothetical protein